jgi:hypothetical protein
MHPLPNHNLSCIFVHKCWFQFRVHTQIKKKPWLINKRLAFGRTKIFVG